MEVDPAAVLDSGRGVFGGPEATQSPCPSRSAKVLDVPSSAVTRLVATSSACGVVGLLLAAAAVPCSLVSSAAIREKGDKMFLESDSCNYTTELKLKSAVATRLGALYHGPSWLRFIKRKELVVWKAYNIRAQVQKLVLLDKVDSRLPFTSVAEKIEVDAILWRASRTLGFIQSHAGESDSGVEVDKSGSEGETIGHVSDKLGEPSDKLPADAEAQVIDSGTVTVAVVP